MSLFVYLLMLVVAVHSAQESAEDGVCAFAEMDNMEQHLAKVEGLLAENAQRLAELEHIIQQQGHQIKNLEVLIKQAPSHSVATRTAEMKTDALKEVESGRLTYKEICTL